MSGEDGADGANDCVKVAVRCRPPSTKELNNNEGNIVQMVEAFTPEDAGTGQVVLNDPAGQEEPAKFAFDIVFGLAILQSQIYESVGRPALAKTFEGYNGTIFAYGQTGSGKSFTMAGAEGDLRGITPRVNEELFARIAEETSSSTRRFLVQCSYFEIYNEIIFDLLNPVSDRTKLGGGLQIKEHPVLGIYVKDLTEIVAEEADKLEQMLSQGNKSRAVSSTLMNSTSSRSHSIFTIKVHQKDTEDASRNVFAKLNLVDLAGSERQKGTGATGQTLKEGANINKSLSALGNVINALVESASGKKVFIPYRNSKLTRVLQESLGGNSLCTMLATLSPAACNYEETMSTLRYANRAKAIKVSATKNEEASQISRLKAEVEELKKKLGNAGAGADGPAGGRGLTDAEREQEKKNYERQLAEMENMLNSNWGDKAKLSEEHEREMKKLAEERRVAEQAIEEERSRRLKLLQEKNDLELSIRGLIDFVAHMPKTEKPPPVLTGEQPRNWLKTIRSLKLVAEELKEHCTMVLVYKHAFDEDVKLWGEGVDVEDMGLAATGLTRCIPKLEKFRKGGEKLLQLQVESLGPASELIESVRQARADIDRLASEVQSQLEAEPGSKAAQAKHSAIAEVLHMLTLVESQVDGKIDEIERKSEIEMLQTCEMVVQFAKSDFGGTADDAESIDLIKQDCDALQSLNLDPSLAALPASMPSKPLSEYTAEDCQNTPETTEALLGQLIRWEGLCGGKTRKTALELLSRPPPKFLLDVTISVKNFTGFPPNIDADWPEARDGKLARFQCIADTVAQALGISSLDFEPADVLKGKEVQKTLYLLQLLAVAAAKSQPTSSKAGAAARRPGVTRPRELPTMLEAMMRCISRVKQYVEAQRKAVVASGEQSLEQHIACVQEQLQEETRCRQREEEKARDVERSLQDTQNEIKHVEQEFELNQNASHDPEEEELVRQLDALTKGASNPEDIPDEDIIKMLISQVQDVRRELTQNENDKTALEAQQQELSRKLQESLNQAKAVEAEVVRERQRRDMEEELMGQSPEEQKLILEAHEKKSRMRAEAIESQIIGLQSETQDRISNLERAQEIKHSLMKQVDDVQLQMEIVQEERDTLREAMEQLFNEKASVDEELENMVRALCDLTERKNQLEDDNSDMREEVMKRKQNLDAAAAA